MPTVREFAAKSRRESNVTKWAGRGGENYNNINKRPNFKDWFVDYCICVVIKDIVTKSSKRWIGSNE